MLTALSTISQRRLALTIRTPRELFVPLLTPILFAVVIAPALNEATGGLRTGGVDYEAFVALATVGLLVPLNMMFSGIAVIVDRETGARRELLAAPIRRWWLVLGNLAVAFAVTALQVVTLLVAALARGVDLSGGATGGIAWFAAAATLFAVGLYGIAETLANRMPSEAEYIAAVPAIAIVPWFFAGSLFPIGALPGVLTAVAKVLPLTHALAVMRYGLIDRSGGGLHDIWGGGDPAALAAASLGVVALFAVATTVLAIRVFNRSAVR
jgi:ABC-2 type transport system permease protein